MLTMAEAVSRYARLIIRYGVDSPRVVRFSERYSDIPDFAKYEKALRVVWQSLAAGATAPDEQVMVEERWEC